MSRRRPALILALDAIVIAYLFALGAFLAAAEQLPEQLPEPAASCTTDDECGCTVDCLD